MKTTITTPIGKISFETLDQSLLTLKFAPPSTKLIAPANLFAHHIAEQLLTYFDNPQHRFNIPTYKQGTLFQQTVWHALKEIKPGTTLTYGDLAKQLKTSPRAIGQACRNNPIPIIVPCHRIVGINNLGGFVGEQLGEMINIKEWLIKHELNLDFSHFSKKPSLKRNHIAKK